MRQEPIARALRAIAEEHIADSDVRNLWPAVRQRLRSRPAAQVRPRLAPTAQIGPAQVRLGRLGATCAMMMLLIFASVAVLPTARTAAQEWAQRFGLILVDRAPHALPSTAPAGAPSAIPQPVYLPQLTLSEAQAQAPFALRLPQWLPQGVTIRGASINQEPIAGAVSGLPSITVYYAREVSPPDFGALQYQMAQGEATGGIFAPAANTQEVTVHDRPALYARGSWRPDGTWNPGTDNALLSWTEGGFTYTVTAVGLGLGQGDLLRIAESIR